MNSLPVLTREQCQAQLDRLLDFKVAAGSRLLVVGDNACGKSLFRQLAANHFKSRPVVAHASMALRTASMSHMGALSGMTRDTDWLATSHNTLSSLKHVIQAADPAKTDGKPVALCVDEPEIGMGAAAQRGLIDWLIPRMEEHAAARSFTILITHSPIFVRAFAAAGWTFTDLSFSPSTTAEEWIARQETETLSPETLEQRAGLLFEVVRDRINASKKKK